MVHMVVDLAVEALAPAVVMVAVEATGVDMDHKREMQMIQLVEVVHSPVTKMGRSGLRIQTQESVQYV